VLSRVDKKFHLKLSDSFMRVGRLLPFVMLLAVTSMARADWINLTGAETAPNIAEIYVLDDHVKLVLEVYVGDLKTFEELIPDEWLKDLDGQRSALAELHRSVGRRLLAVLRKVCDSRVSSRITMFFSFPAPSPSDAS